VQLMFDDNDEMIEHESEEEETPKDKKQSKDDPVDPDSLKKSL